MVKKETAFIGNYKIVTITSGKLEQNCFIVQHLDSGDIIVIDPGGAADEIINTISQDGGQLKHVLLTHGHFDHVGAVKSICDNYGLPYWVDIADIKLLRRAPIYAISMEKRNFEISLDFKHFIGPISEWGGNIIEIISTPGHTPGSVCFLIDNMVFTGDIILTEQKVKIELPGFDNSVLSTSINRILFDLSDDTFFFPGHGEPDTIKNIRKWWSEISYRAEILKTDKI
jgi:glyoxylase-like metal-dependent hydrolase (beta-lactamase superfamily II)